MNAWAKDLGIEHVKMLTTETWVYKKHGTVGRQVKRRVWQKILRYAMIVKNSVIVKQWVEEGKADNAEGDPYSNTDPGTVINWIRGPYGQDKLSKDY